MAVRRSLKRKKEEEQMGDERESRQSSVRARISRDREWDDPGNKEQSAERKRFALPAKTGLSPDSFHHQQKQHQQQPLVFPTGARPRAGATDFEAHLQEVWSVRKNIHHKQQQPSPVTANTGSKTSILQSGGGGVSLTQADKYSRHRAIPPPEHSQHRNRDALKDSNSAVIETVTPWSLRKPSTKFNTKYSTDTSPPRQQRPHEMASSSPAVRGRGRGRGRGGEPVRICREDFEPTSTHKRDHREKVDYAKSMAQGYLRSVGSGEYAPPEGNYIKEPLQSPEGNYIKEPLQSHTDTTAVTEQATKWKRTDSDEFDF